MNSDDPLSVLEVDADEVDRSTLAALLKDYVSIDRKNGRLHLHAGFTKLDAKGKITKYLLACKARSLLMESEDGAIAKDIIGGTGLPSGTAHPTLRGLADGRVINQSPDKRYFIPNWSLAELAAQEEA